MSRLARSVCGLSAENRSAFDTAVLFLRWHQLAANPLLYRKLCALVSHEITESRLELKPGKMSTLDLAGWGWGGGVSLVFSLLPESFFIIFPSGGFGTACISNPVFAVYLYETTGNKFRSAEVQTSHPGIPNVPTFLVLLSSATILYVHVHHMLFMRAELLSVPVLISSCQTDLYLIDTEWHWPASAWQASMDIPVNWDHFGPSFISN